MTFCVTKDSKLQKNALEFLFHRNSNEDSNGCLETLGGVLSNFNYSWIVNGSKFIIVRCKNGARVGSWDFATTLKDETSEIIGIDEIHRPHGKEPLLAISINCVSSGGIVCILDFIRSKVIRAIQIGEHISSLHVIGCGRDIFNLSGPLRNFDGIFAVGTVGGDVYIVDICWHLCYEELGTLQAKDEINPSLMYIIPPQDLDDIENHKKAALHNESHLAIHLNVVLDKTTEHFVLKEPSGTDKVYVNKQEVLISALHYCSPLGSILVGYNFGAFQLWNLMRMELTYTSPICDDHVPISKFAVQEPTDDPRAFCYVWAVYSSDDLTSSLLPYLVMYALCYESKDFHESYGVIYENFQYCSVRFHRELGFNNQSVVNPRGGKCLKLESLVHKNTISNSEMCITDGSEDVVSICVIVWKALCESGIFTYMSLFDLNQWYKAQLPNTLDHECSSYMITLCVTDVIDTTEENSDIYDLAVNKNSINQFMGIQRLEEHYHPSALSFDSYCLLENRCVIIQYQGIQKALLYQLQSSGPMCLIRPTEIYQEIVSLGLTPLFVEVSSSPAFSHISLKDQRETILNVALEQQLMNWLCKCASEWANGSFSSAGCSLELLTTWAFRRGIVLKRNCDNICVPLFDHSEVRLDTNTAKVLNNCIRQIKNISFFHSFIMNNLSSHVINKDLMVEQCHTLQMVEVYFDVLQWLFNVGLLPEYSPSSFSENISENRIRAPYPAEKLMQYYSQRRSELLLLQNKRFCSKSTILFIDNLIKTECGGEKLWKEWKNDGGDGFYPPISLQALLRTYLINDVEVCNKHAVVMYLLLDLTMSLDSTKYALAITHFIKFPSVFKLSPSLIKITQAFWQLDHGDFSTAMEQLLDPLVNQEDLKYWHHKVALKSLLIQEQHNSALLYMHVRKPPILDDEDVLCALSLFISNNMLDEAFYLEKHYKSFHNSKEFIKHLITECGNYGCLNSILYRNLSDEEEKIFLQYLDEVKHPEASDLKITYFMQRSHYIEAFKTYQSCEGDPSRKGLFSRLNASTRDQIIHSYKKLLPTVSYKFIESCTSQPNPMLWKEVSRPEPMSVTVHGTEEKPEYKSSLIFTALAKAKQASDSDSHNAFSLMNATTEEIPFLRTPTLPLSRKRMSVQVIIPKVIIKDEGMDLLQGKNQKTSILSTPLIARKHRREISPISKGSCSITATPTSILKVKHSYIEESFNNFSSSMTEESSKTRMNSKQGISSISGRKSVSRTPIVRFDVPKASTSSEEHTLSPSILTFQSDKESPTSKSNNSNSMETSLQNLSHSLPSTSVSGSDDVFFSPNSSLNDQGSDSRNDVCVTGKQNEDIEKNEEVINPTELSLKISPKKPAIVNEAKLVKLVDYSSSASSSIDTPSSSVTNSPSARRSYKKLPDEGTFVRSSPRLRRNQKLSISETGMVSQKILQSITGEAGENDNSTSSSNVTSVELIASKVLTPVSDLAVKPRKSLSRRVLENNAFSRLSSNEVNNSIATVFHSEQKEKSAVSIDNKTTEFTYSTTEYADVYSTQSITTENFIEKHSKTTSFSSVKETVLDSEQDSIMCSLSDTPGKRELEDLVSNSFMEELVDNLRDQRCREISSYKQSDKQFQEEKSSDIIKDKTPLRITRALSRRLSMDRTISSENSSKESVSKKYSRRVSEERSILSPDMPLNTISKGVTTSTRTSRSLSAERSITCVNDSKSSPARSPRRRLSEERSISSSNDSELHRHDENKINVLNFTSRSRISRRLSSEKPLMSEGSCESSNSQTKVDAEKPIQRFSKRLTPERSLSLILNSTSSTSDIVNEKSDVAGTVSPKISSSQSVEDIETSSFSKKDESTSMPQRFSKRLSAERTLSSDVSLTSGNEDKEKARVVKIPARVKCRKSLGRQVLENNTFSRLMSEYQSPDEKDDTIEVTQIRETVKPILDSSSQSFQLNETNLSLSDSLLEEIAFKESSSEKIILSNQLQTVDQVIENKNEQSSAEEHLDLDQQDQCYSHDVIKEKNVDNSDLIVEDPISRIEHSQSLDLYAVNQKSVSNEVCNINEPDKEHHSTINGEKNAELSKSIEGENSQDRKITVEAINENKDIDIVTLDKVNNVDEAEENEQNKNEAENENFSFVYEDLSNESTKLNELEVNVFGISGDLSLQHCITEKLMNVDNKEEPCKYDTTQLKCEKDEVIEEDQSIQNARLNDSQMNIFEIQDDSSSQETIMDIDTLQKSSLPSVFERNITSYVSSSSDGDVPADESDSLKPTSKMISEVIEIRSSSEDREIKSIPSNSTSYSRKSRTSSSSNVSTTASSTEEKVHVSTIQHLQSKVKDVQIEYQKGKILNQSSNEKKSMSTEERACVINKESYDTEINISLEKENLEILPEIDSSTLSVDSSNKRNVELQTGKSLLEIENNDNNDIHGNNSNKKSAVDDNITPSRRMTRRRSKLIEENDAAGPLEDNISLKKSDNFPVKDEGLILLGRQQSRLSIEPASPSQVNLKVTLPTISSASSSSKPVKTYCRKRTRSVDTPIIETTTESTLPTTENKQLGRRKLRSASVDAPISLEKISETSESIEDNLSLLSDLNTANKERKNRRKPSKTIKRSLVENYSNSRRLTRRQSNIIQTTLKEIDEEVEINEVRLTKIESNARIDLLNKSNFEGTPDPEEERIYETSPSSVGMSSSVSNIQRARRSSRSSSNASESSITHSKMLTQKRTRSISECVDYPKSEVPRTKQRSSSTDEKSDKVKKVRTSKASTAAIDGDETSSSLKKSRKSTKPKRYTDTTKTRKRKGGIGSNLSQIKEEN
ncbi:hypothetical protein WA026_000735 [Henosepilachna vigintioctopunctata]|uniref:Protein ELYS n=1 Tax=Henosepilachna vigintioctopunctata TaxID=420089 RepID=A0AAW1UZF5_9CUCU